MKDRLEPEYAGPLKAHLESPTPATASAVLKAINPLVSLGARTYGGGDSPLIRSRARRIALDAIPKYDSSKSSLKTHLMAHFKGLQRYSAKLDQPINVPEQVVIDHHRLHAASSALREEHGRDPSDVELADRTGMSTKRIAHVRGFRPGTAEGEVASMFSGGDDGEEGPYEPAVVGADPTKIRAQLIYHDAHPIDQLILEHSLGLNGAEILQHREIARKAGVSPAAISQRARKLQERLDQLDDWKVLG